MNDTAERVTLQEASTRYHIPVATLRSWLIQGQLGDRQYEKGKVTISVAALQRKIAQRQDGDDQPA